AIADGRRLLRRARRAGTQIRNWQTGIRAERRARIAGVRSSLATERTAEDAEELAALVHMRRQLDEVRVWGHRMVVAHLLRAVRRHLHLGYGVDIDEANQRPALLVGGGKFEVDPRIEVGGLVK